MKKVIFTVGLPASGKTTWAKEQVGKGNGLIKRVSKDDLRAMIDADVYSKDNEAEINRVLNSLCYHYLQHTGANIVIIDGCNLNKHVAYTKEYFKEATAHWMDPLEYEIKEFDTTPTECVERNKTRGGNLPEKVVWDMLARYQEEGKFLAFALKDDKQGWIGFGLDGTLVKYDEWEGIEHFGEVIPKMMDRLKQHRAEGDRVKIFTARAHDPKAVPHIRKWLIEQGLNEVGITNVKDFSMKILYDDRCVQVIPNTGELLRDKIK